MNLISSGTELNLILFDLELRQLIECLLDAMLDPREQEQVVHLEMFH